MFSTMKTTLAAFAAAGLLFAGCAKQNVNPARAEKCLDPKNMDTTIAPGEDFFRYANGSWMKNNPIPDEYSRWGSFNELQEKNNDMLKTVVEEAAANPGSKGSVKQKIGDFFSAGMDTNAIEKAGITPLKEELAKINAINNLDDVLKVIAHMHTLGLSPVFGIYSGQDEKNSEMVIAQLAQSGLGMGQRDYYTENDPRSQELRAKYVVHMSKMFALTGDNAEVSSKKSKEIMEFETKLANISMTLLEQRDPQATYNKMSVEKLQSLCPSINWNNYFATIGLNNPGELNVSSVKYFSGLSKIMNETSVEVWKEYLNWNLLNSFASYLSSGYVNEHFDFFGKTFSGSKKLLPRWKRVLSATNEALGEGVGQIYVEKYFPAEAKTRMLKLVDNLRKALDERISMLKWMSEPTKLKAKEKLASMKVKIGYPDKWRDYSNLSVDKSKGYAGNALEASKFDFKFMISKVNKPVDRGEWGMTPQTVNAYYSPNMNEIVFPAAILQPPFFFKDGDDAVNYGGIGGVIGHEMTHGFDDQGRQYDSKGNLNDWWTKEDADNFKKQTQPLIDQFNKFQMGEGLTVNGELTLGENIADIGGITVSHVAFLKTLTKETAEAKIDGLTPEQRFLLSWAQVWRANIRPEEMKRRLKDDVHSPAEARVNGVMPNFAPFYKAFNVKPGQKLYRPEEERAIIW